MTKKEKILYIIDELIAASKATPPNEKIKIYLTNLPMGKEEAFDILYGLHHKYPLFVFSGDLMCAPQSRILFPDEIEVYNSELFQVLRDKMIQENNKHHVSKKEQVVYLKPDTEGGDELFGDGYHITPKGIIYRDEKQVAMAQKAGYYLIVLLKKTKKSYGREFFNSKGKFKWSTIKKVRTIIVKHCGDVIGTNTEDKYYWAYTR